MANILYITYNGLLDHIGTAQVLPYLLPAARAGHRITIVSFEKSATASRRAALATQLRAHNIDWHPQRFHSGPPVLNKLRDLWSLRRVTRRLCRSNDFDLLHCRSYIPAATGITLKRRFNVPLLFDMRGLWVDQRLEGGRWPQRNPLYTLLYRYWKKREAAIIQAADDIVTLTESCAAEVRRWPSYSGARITVCPCCVDTRLFAPRTDDVRAAIRNDLGVSRTAPVLVYLGSIGSVYCMRESLQFFAALYAHRPDARFLFLGFHGPNTLITLAKETGLSLPDEVFVTRTLERTEIPDYLAAGDAGLCFIMPSYSSKGVSPTKLGEFLACGLPVYSNRNIGDVERLARQIDSLQIVTDFSEDNLRAITSQLRGRDHSERLGIAHAASPFIAIETALQKYQNIYQHYDSRQAHA